jgi:hypothetical protein
MEKIKMGSIVLYTHRHVFEDDGSPKVSPALVIKSYQVGDEEPILDLKIFFDLGDMNRVQVKPANPQDAQPLIAGCWHRNR